jgi:uncharacterized protein
MNETVQNASDRHCLVMMTRFPEAGCVKTRLAADVGDDCACELYRNFILDLRQTLSSEAWSFRLAIYPCEKKAEMAAVIGDEVVQVLQKGNNLGERMEDVFNGAFAEGFYKVVMIGSDAPDLPQEFVAEAFAALGDHDAVLGPACDGGYYLIGLDRAGFHGGIFDGLPWSTPELFPQQMMRFREQALRVYILPPWQDIDTLADLKNMVGLAAATPFADSRTMAYIQAAGLLR